MQSADRYEGSSALNINRPNKSLSFLNHVLIYETSYFNWRGINNIVTDMKDYAAEKVTFTVLEFLDSHNLMCLL